MKGTAWAFTLPATDLECFAVLFSVLLNAFFYSKFVKSLANKMASRPISIQYILSCVGRMR